MATRILHTGLYGIESSKIITALWQCVKDKYNSQRNTARARSVSYTDVMTADDNECVFQLDTFRRSWKDVWPFDGWNDKRILEHIAWEIKCAVLRRAEWVHDDVKKTWKRRNNAMYQFPNSNGKQIPVSKIYFIYDKFRGRNTEKRYPAEYVDELIAVPLDPIMTEMKIAQKEEIKKLEEQLNMTIQKLNNECYAEKERVRIEIGNKYNKMVNDARAETAKKIEALKAEMESFTALSLAS